MKICSYITLLVCLVIQFEVSGQTSDSLKECKKANLTNFRWGNIIFNDSLKTHKEDILFRKEKLHDFEPYNFFNSVEFKLLLSGIAAFGTAATVLKIKADDYYDKYNDTGEQHYLDKTRQYDLFSGISFGFLQLNFLYMLFKFLFIK